MTEYEFTVYFSADEYLQYYSGAAKAVQVTSRCGKTIQFPADKMREFVSATGIHGHFIIQLDNNNKFISLKRVPNS